MEYNGTMDGTEGPTTHPLQDPQDPLPHTEHPEEVLTSQSSCSGARQTYCWYCSIKMVVCVVVADGVC